MRLRLKKKKRPLMARTLPILFSLEDRHIFSNARDKAQHIVKNGCDSHVFYHNVRTTHHFEIWQEASQGKPQAANKRLF